MTRTYQRWLRNGLTFALVLVLLGATSAATYGQAPAASQAPAARAASSCTPPNPWQPASAMVTPHPNAIAVYANGHVFVLGGILLAPYWHEIDSVESAPIGADGTLGAWAATSPLPQRAQAFGVAAINDDVYVVGGWNGSQALSTVERAAALDDGQLGPWEAETPLPDTTYGRINLQAVATGTHLYALGGWNYSGTDVTQEVKYAAVNADGSLGPWTATSSMLIGRGSFGAVIAGQSIYVVGGNQASGVGVGISSVERAAINADGSLGAWQEMSPLLQPGLGQLALVSGGYLYAIGGGTATYGITLDSVERAAILDDGTLGPWEYVDPLITGRAGHSGVSVNGRFYIMAGWASTNGSDFAVVNSSEQVTASDLALPSENGLSINDGALFTNQTAVTLTISGQPGTAQMLVSNDGGFAGAKWQDCVASIPWTVTQYGNSTIARVVYVKFKDTHGTVSSTYSDDIILDVTAPTGSVHMTPLAAAANRPAPANLPHKIYLPLVARAACIPGACPPNVMLHLSANDDASGVGGMQISADPSFASGQWQPYAASQAWYLPDGLTTVYVRFRDNAGNVSSVASATLGQ